MIKLSRIEYTFTPKIIAINTLNPFRVAWKKIIKLTVVNFLMFKEIVSKKKTRLLKSKTLIFHKLHYQQLYIEKEINFPKSQHN